MKRLWLLAAFLVVAGCSNGADEDVQATSTVDDQPVTVDKQRHLIVRTTGWDPADDGGYLTLYDTDWDEASGPTLRYWSFDEDPELNLGDWVTVVEPEEMCQDSFPEGCFARTAEVVDRVGDEVALFGPYNDEYGRTEAEIAYFIGTAVVNAGEPFTDDELMFTGSDVRVIDTDGSDLAGHPDLPDTDRAILVSGTAEQVDELTQVLFDEGYGLVIAYAD